jgi:large subunit ribosomal protein L9
MKVILLENIEKLGKKHDIKEVAGGFARNYLIPNGLAKAVNETSLKWLEKEKTLAQKRAEEELQREQNLASSVDGLEVMLVVKRGEKGQLFESITPQKIADKLLEMGFKIEKNQIELDKNIEEVGEFPLKILFKHNLEANIRVVVMEENGENNSPIEE